MPVLRAALCLSACLAVLGGAASAQPATDDVVVVTGARAPQARNETALPVAVLDSEEIERLGAHHVSEALNRLPGVFIHRGNGAEHLTAIRSPVLTGGAGAGSFLYLEDGVPLRAAGFANVNGLFEAVDDLAGRIEVVRGPGSAVYGSNALHGLVNVISADPLSAGRSVELEAGSFGRARLRAEAGGATGFGAGYLGLSLRSEDGWRDDASLSRAALQARLDGEEGATRWSLRLAGVDLDQETATFVQGFKAYEDEALSRQNADPEAFRNGRAVRAALHLERDFSPTLSGRAVAYGRSNDLQFRLHFLPSEALEESGHDSLGVQTGLTWSVGASRLTIGADLELTDGYLYEFQARPTVGPFVQGLHYDYTVQSVVAAGFVQGRAALSPRLQLEGGVRLEQTRYDYDNAAPDGVVGRYLRPADRSDDFTTVTPNLGLTFAATDAVQLFARAARGVRAPQTAELYRLQPGQVIDGIDPEELDSVEAGLRWTPRAGARVELTGFAMEKRNVFFRDADGFNVTDGKTRHEGVELDLLWPLADTLTLAASASWAIHEYAFDRALSRSSDVIVNGARVDTAPEWLGNARLTWTPVEALTGELEWIHVGDYFADAGNTARYEGHDLINLRARWRVSDQIEVFTAVRNVLDDRYAERADFAFGNYRYFPGEPRSVSFGVRLRG